LSASNRMMTEEIELDEDDVIVSIPLTPEIRVSTFLVTNSSTSAGEAPGKTTLTTAIGIFTSGLDSRGSLKYEYSPHPEISMISRITTRKRDTKKLSHVFAQPGMKLQTFKIF